MKLAPLPVHETSVKLALSVKKSTNELLTEYQSCYEQAYGQSVTQRDLIESMLLSFIDSDKSFLKWQQSVTPDAPVAAKNKRPARSNAQDTSGEEA